MKTTIECPYCKHRFKTDALGLIGHQIETCPPDEGGCDQDFVFSFALRVDARYRKIQGAEDIVTGGGA